MRADDGIYAGIHCAERRLSGGRLMPPYQLWTVNLQKEVMLANGMGTAWRQVKSRSEEGRVLVVDDGWIESS